MMSKNPQLLLGNPSLIIKDPNEKIVQLSALFSKCIYKESTDEDFPVEYEVVHHENGDSKAFRTATWAVYFSKEENIAFLTFRGSVTLMDWVVNISVSPIEHPDCPGAKVHSGYFAEIQNEFVHILGILSSVMNPTTELIVTGHSKGGGLAQVFAYRLFHDREFWAARNSSLLCITFAAPMIFWFPDEEPFDHIQCFKVMHNYIIKGDPVPILHLLLIHNREAVARIAGWTYTLSGIDATLGAASAYFHGYRIVGKLYAANLKSMKQTDSLEFQPEEPNPIPSKWTYVKTIKHNVAHHDVKLYHKILDKDYETRLDLRRAHTCGVYIENHTHEDILIVLSTTMTPMHWKKIPKRKIRYISSKQMPLTITATIFDEKDVPTEGGVVMKVAEISLFPGPGVALATNLASSLLLTKKKNRLSNITANGQTIRVDPVDDVARLEVSEVKGKERSWNYSCTVGEEKEGKGEEGKGAIAEK